jgi:putative colanic acid biosynthesis acetyltransferase WcaF
MLSRYSDPAGTLANAAAPKLGGPTFSLRNRILRGLWTVCWLVLARWTPPQMLPLRRALLVLFGAHIHPTANIRSSVRIWWPAHLEMGRHASLGPGVTCYNVARITIGDFADVSQRAHLCSASHEIDDGGFRLVARPINIGSQAWIAAEAFVGPGVSTGRGAVLGARGVAFRDLDDWTVYVGNPARPVRKRRFSPPPDLAGKNR